MIAGTCRLLRLDGDDRPEMLGERGGGYGYDGADDDTFREGGRVPYTSERRSWVDVPSAEPVPKSANFPHPPVSSSIPLAPGMEDKLKHIPTFFKPHASPLSIS